MPSGRTRQMSLFNKDEYSLPQLPTVYHLTPAKQGASFRQRMTPALSGSGPEGKVCLDCKHAAPMGTGEREWFACGLMSHLWTSGDNPEINRYWKVCKRFEDRTEPTQENRT